MRYILYAVFVLELVGCGYIFYVDSKPKKGRPGRVVVMDNSREQAKLVMRMRQGWYWMGALKND